MTASYDAVGGTPRVIRALPFGAAKVVVQTFIVQFVVFAWVGDVVVVDIAVAVSAPFGIHGDGGLSTLGLFGSDKDDTVGTARAIEGVGGRIFQHADTLNVLRVEIAVIATVRQPVNDNQRFCTGIDGTDASDEDGGAAGLRIVALHHLHAGYLTVQRLYSVARL